MKKNINEQLIGGFIAPGGEETFKTELGAPDFGNFVMSARQLLQDGVSMGGLVDKLLELPKPEVPDREEDNSYEIPRSASGGEPYNPG